MASIRLVNIEKYFDKNHVIRRLNLEIKDREYLVLLGPSGCGKTTTLRAIAGLEEIDGGEIFIDGKPVHRLRASDRDIAFVFQFYALYPHLNVFDNIAFPLKAARESKHTVEKRVKEVAKVLKIESILTKNPSALSSGDMQRVAVGRAMVRRPKAILMDEPIGSLDAKLREEMRTELKRLHREIHATTLYVTHDQVEAMSMADRIAIMDEGVLKQIGSPAEIYDHPANLFVAQFIGSPVMNVLDCIVDFDGSHTKIFLGNGGAHLNFSKSVYHKISEKVASDAPLSIGVRPEAIKVAREPREGYLKVEVHVIEPVGPYDIVDVKIGDHLIRAKTAARFVERPGESIWFKLDEKRTHFFDKETGNVLDG
jgi:multiple sugar transport system ATP-binding protein